MGIVYDELVLNLALSAVVIGLLVAMPLIPSVVEAQSPPLTISKSASPDPIVAGNELTYIIIITNTGHVPLTGVVMTDMVPRHTTFVLVSGWGSDWWMQTPSLERQGEIVWRHNGSLSPGQVSRLRFVVRAEATNAEPIVSQGCRVMAEGWNTMVSEPVTTQVLLPTPTPTPLSPPMPPTATPPPTPVPPTATPTPGPTPVPPTASPLPTFLPTPQKDQTSQAPSFGPSFGRAALLIGLVVIIAASIPLLIWLAKKWGAAQ
jgi:uncharacterized repeat protein (TIGR01451 family)